MQVSLMASPSPLRRLPAWRARYRASRRTRTDDDHMRWSRLVHSSVLFLIGGVEVSADAPQQQDKCEREACTDDQCNGDEPLHGLATAAATASWTANARASSISMTISSIA